MICVKSIRGGGNPTAMRTARSHEPSRYRGVANGTLENGAMTKAQRVGTRPTNEAATPSARAKYRSAAGKTYCGAFMAGSAKTAF
jgi:hypothetical protein